MTTNYDAIAEQYKLSKLAPWRRYIEQYTVFDILGDITGLSVLDLACGEGFYSRLFRLHGASRVVGVDLSEEMIRLARSSEAEQPLDIEYLVADAGAFRPAEKFDVVAAAYLLNYADTEEKLSAMCRTIAGALKPGGRFVTVNNNPSQATARFEATRPYGFIKSATGPLRPGTPITYTLFLDGGEAFRFDNYYLSRQAHERALAGAGFQQIEWIQPRLSPEVRGDRHWDGFFTDPAVIFLRCRKA